MSSPAETGKNAPQLAAPGAGLPKIELFVARLLVRWKARRATRAGSAALFARERAAILALARGCDDETGRRRVLIQRLTGLEDSSRFWSVYMTLDHLRIVNLGAAETIKHLGRGKVPSRAVSIADVKPRPDVDASVIKEFQGACDHYERCAAAVENLRTPLRRAHPWFGPLDAAGWHFMAALHMSLHRRQIEAILRGMGC